MWRRWNAFFFARCCCCFTSIPNQAYNGTFARSRNHFELDRCAFFALGAPRIVAPPLDSRLPAQIVMDTWLNISFDASIFVYSNNLIVVHFTRCSPAMCVFVVRFGQSFVRCLIIAFVQFGSFLRFSFFFFSSFLVPFVADADRWKIETWLQKIKPTFGSMAQVFFLAIFFSSSCHPLGEKKCLIGSMNISGNLSAFKTIHLKCNPLDFSGSLEWEKIVIDF